MELHQLRYLVSVVDEGGFTAAAAALHISQSGVSTQVHKLERELGVTVLDRSARRVALTPAGRRILPSARAVLAAVEDVRGTAEAIRGLVTGTVRVATVTGLVWPPLFDAMARVHAEHPGIDLRLQEGNSADLLAGLRSGALDVAIAAWAGEPPDGVGSSVLIEDSLVAVVAEGHPWGEAARVSASEVAAADVVALPHGTGARAALDAWLDAAGVPRVTPRWEVSTPASVHMLASRGIGVGIVSAATAEGWEGTTSVPLAGPAAHSTLGIVWRESPSHAARALLAALAPEGQAPVSEAATPSRAPGTRE